MAEDPPPRDRDRTRQLFGLQLEVSLVFTVKTICYEKVNYTTVMGFKEC